MSYRFLCRPLLAFPVPETPAGKRREARFLVRSSRDDAGGYRPTKRTPVAQTLDELHREIVRLGTTDAVLEVDLAPEDLRTTDGWPRADARARTPRVVLSLQTPLGPLQYPCDTFTRWEDNVRAIRLSLEALRAVDRYGVTGRGQQYTGFLALPPGDLTVMTPMQAAGLLAREAGGLASPTEIASAEGSFRAAYRLARAAVHPDRCSGDRRRWDRVEEAAEVLSRSLAVRR